MEKLFAGLNGNNCFTLFDVSNAIRKCQQKVLYYAPYEKFGFTVLPFRLWCAPEMFQQAISEVHAAQPVSQYFDDIIFVDIPRQTSVGHETHHIFGTCANAGGYRS